LGFDDAGRNDDPVWWLFDKEVRVVPFSSENHVTVLVAI
jgi:hypothetical protein